MARRLRIQYAGAAYHVMSRGVLRGIVFSSQEDYAHFVSCLARAQEKFKLDIFAFALMINHYHLFLRTREANLSRALQWLQTAYSVYYNRRHRRNGHLFEGRFKAIIVGEESYWTGLTIYIHLNPVRAGAVDDPGDYKWSSYRDYIEKQKIHEWVRCEEILSSGGKDIERQRIQYREAMRNRSGRERTILDDLKHGMILGSEKFVRWIRDKIVGRRMPSELNDEPSAKRKIRDSEVGELVISAVAQEFGARKESLVKRNRRVVNLARDVAMHILSAHTTMSKKTIGAAFGVGPDAVGKASGRMEEYAAKHEPFKNKIERLVTSVFHV